MNNPIEEYKRFVDALVEEPPDVLVSWVKEIGFPRTKDNAKYNQLLLNLSPEQRELISEIVNNAHVAGIQFTLSMLEGFTITSPSGIVLPVEPFYNQLHYDFISRFLGQSWPTDDSLVD